VHRDITRVPRGPQQLICHYHHHINLPLLLTAHTAVQLRAIAFFQSVAMCTSCSDGDNRIAPAHSPNSLASGCPNTRSLLQWMLDLMQQRYSSFTVKETVVAYFKVRWRSYFREPDENYEKPQ